MAGTMSDEELRTEINAIKQHSGDFGMAIEEYFEWMSYVRDHAPQRLLVWGLGWDSLLLDRLNKGGVTAFLEPDAAWIAQSSNKDLNYKAYDQATFGTRVKDWRDFLKKPHGSALSKQFGVQCWDTILVDSPNGYYDTAPGRAVPMYTSRLDVEDCLARNMYMDNQTVSIFVHDCNRAAEDGLSKALLGVPIKQTGPKKLRHYVFKTDEFYLGMRSRLTYVSGENSVTFNSFSLIALCLAVMLLAYRLMGKRLHAKA